MVPSDPPPPYPGGPQDCSDGELRGHTPASGPVLVMATSPVGPSMSPGMGYPRSAPALQSDFLSLNPYRGGPTPRSPDRRPSPPHCLPSPSRSPSPSPSLSRSPSRSPSHRSLGPSPGSQTSTGTRPSLVISPSQAASLISSLQENRFRTLPVQTVCWKCHQRIRTRITKEIGLMNIIACVVCCFIGCDLGCCLIPCMIEDLKDVRHTCPNCKGHIYTYMRHEGS
ncbi:hypothetical protein JZ751_006215, partial [Albula glossodonta]